MMPRPKSCIEPMNRTIDDGAGPPLGSRLAEEASTRTQTSRTIAMHDRGQPQLRHQAERVAAEADQAVDRQPDQPRNVYLGRPASRAARRRRVRSGESRRTTGGRGRTASARAGA